MVLDEKNYYDSYVDLVRKLLKSSLNKSASKIPIHSKYDMGNIVKDVFSSTIPVDAQAWLKSSEPTAVLTCNSDDQSCYNLVKQKVLNSKYEFVFLLVRDAAKNIFKNYQLI